MLTYLRPSPVLAPCSPSSLHSAGGLPTLDVSGDFLALLNHIGRLLGYKSVGKLVCELAQQLLHANVQCPSRPTSDLHFCELPRRDFVCEQDVQLGKREASGLWHTQICPGKANQTSSDPKPAALRTPVPRCGANHVRVQEVDDDCGADVDEASPSD